MGKQATPKPAHYPEEVRDMLLKNEEIPKFIEFTNNMELSNKIVANVDFLRFVSLYKEFWEYVIALSYGATNIPLRPRLLLVENATSLACELRSTWHGFELKQVAKNIGFNDGKEGEDEQRLLEKVD